VYLCKNKIYVKSKKFPLSKEIEILIMKIAIQTNITPSTWEGYQKYYPYQK
jgi:hypothetical protein